MSACMAAGLDQGNDAGSALSVHLVCGYVRYINSLITGSTSQPLNGNGRVGNYIYCTVYIQFDSVCFVNTN